MTYRASNRVRNAWTVELLELSPGLRVLEIGCGPGLALEACLVAQACLQLEAIDHSEVMLRQAAIRNQRALETGRLRLRRGAFDDLELSGVSYDRIYSSNLVMFLPDKMASFTRMRELLVPGGRLASTHLPRAKNATAEDALRFATEIERIMARTGFEAIRTEQRTIGSDLAVCVIGKRPAAGAAVDSDEPSA